MCKSISLLCTTTQTSRLHFLEAQNLELAGKLSLCTERNEVNAPPIPLLRPHERLHSVISVCESMSCRSLCEDTVSRSLRGRFGICSCRIELPQRVLLGHPFDNAILGVVFVSWLCPPQDLMARMAQLEQQLQGHHQSVAIAEDSVSIAALPSLCTTSC